MVFKRQNLCLPSVISHRHSRSSQDRLALIFQSSICPSLLLEIELFILAFATGIQDATTYPDYRFFTSNQTGNWVLLSVGALRMSKGAFDVQNVGVSIGTFILSGFLFGQAGRLVGHKRRMWVLFTNFVQTALVYAAIGIQFKTTTISNSKGPIAMTVVALLAVSGAGQVSMVRALGMPEITTAMATSAFVDLIVEPRMPARENKKRDRRLIFLLAMVGGAFVGAFVTKSINSPVALLLSAIGKTVVTLLFFFNRRAEQDQ